MSVVPEGYFQREINSKPQVAVRMEHDKLELTIKSLNIIFYVDNDGPQRWTINLVAWTSADKGGGNCGRS